MPKVNMTKYNSQKKAEDDNCISITCNIKKHMRQKELSDKQMANYTGMAPGTFARKREHPHLFTYPELMRLFKYLDFTDVEILEALKCRT